MTGEEDGDSRMPSLPETRRFPGWLLIPLGAAAGGIVGGWGGAAFGALAGLLIWRGRSG